MKKLFYINVLVCFLISACTEVPVTIPEFQVPTTNRVVLLEDLTGVRCPNCPKGAAAIESILAKYKDKVVAVGIHGDFLTKPLPESKFDFRNPKAIALEELLKPFLGKPSAQINRRMFPDELFTCVDAIELWDGYIGKELQRDQEMEIILNKNYNASTRQLDITVTAASLIAEDVATKISVYLTESKIIDPQESAGKILPSFQHNHVLRDMLTAANGDLLSSSLSKGQTITKTYTYSIPANMIAENMEIVAMVARDKPNDKSVLQAKGLKVGK